MKKISFIIAAFGVFSIAAQTAFAHVTLDPREAIPGRQNYWVRVPSERPVPTVSVRLVVPETVDVTRVIPAAGWSYAIKRASVEHSESGEGDAGHAEEEQGKITEITWSGGRVQPDELMLFGISTNYTGDPTTISWKAYQTYANGEVVAWDDSSEGTPSPKVVVSAKTKIDSTLDSVNALAGRVDALEKDKRASLNQWLAGGALLLAIIALVLGMRKQTA